MPAKGGNSGPYQVHGSAAIAERLWRVQERAAREGRGEKVLEAVRHIYERLQNDPTTVGEPLYRLPNLRMEVRTVVYGPVAIDFGVCEDQPLVFLKGIKLLSKDS